MTIVQLPPFDLRVIYDWMQPDAVMAARFTGATPQCWLDAAMGPMAASDLFAVTRSSSIHLPDSAGDLQTIGINALPRTDRGLFPNDQVTNSIRYSEDLTPANWTKDAVTISPLHYRYLTKIIESETNAIHGLRGSSYVSIAEGEVRRLSLDVKAAGRSVILIGAYSSFSVGTTLRVDLTDGSFTGGTNAKVTPLGDGIFRIETSGVGTANGTAAIQIRIGDGPYMGDGVSGLLISRIQMNAGDYFPFYVPTPTNAIATTMASDIRAVKGVRPSNSQPEPFAGWEDAGLDNAFGGKNIITIDRMNADEPRFITGAGVDADNLTKLIFDTDNRFKLIVRKSGVDEVALQTGAVSSTGDKTIEWQAKPGDYGIDATGVAGDTDSDAETLPAGSTTLRVGSDFGALNPFNGWIKELQILKVAA